MAYNPLSIESNWQSKWDTAKVYKSAEDPSKQKFYALDMFPYPSAAGLHVGHLVGYLATDISARYHRMLGHCVLHPMGWDAFGLPAEQHAIETGEHPASLTYRNIANYKATLQKVGMSYDWDREIVTCDPGYYKWTQWIFKLLFDKGLAYQAEVAVNWCPDLRTVLANDEVVDGKSERGGHPVFRVPMRQWMLKITAYAERLLAGLETIDWPDSVKEIQRNWIGKSKGAKVTFKTESNESIEVFTTRPDTLFGVSYLVLAPDHPMVQKLVTDPHKPAVTAYCLSTSKKSDFERTEMNKVKTGEFTGAYCIHPVTLKKLPIWIGDMVLLNYGTGAVMAVPAHDDRDHEFATKFGLPIYPVIAPTAPGPDKGTHDFTAAAYTGAGTIHNSDFLNGLPIAEAQLKVTAWLTEHGCGESCINYRFRDWLFSRQRYWGEPFPLFKDSSGNVLRAAELSELPITLPEVTSYQPTPDGKSPLASLQSWVQVTDAQGVTEFRESDTMPGAAGSSWYFLRYCDPHNTNAPFDKNKAKYWMPIDLYVGGQEHAVGHLLYARFWTMVLFDAGISPVSEPIHKLVNQGMLCRNGAKMSKSKGNGVNPDEIIATYGADALRVYLMFMGPVTQTKDWDDANLAGMHRFLSRVYRLMLDDNDTSLVDDSPATPADYRIVHKSIKKISDDMPHLAFNTSLAQMMVCLNALAESGCRNREILSIYTRLLCPFAPHLAEHLWSRALGNTDFAVSAPWPVFQPELAADNEITLGVQVNGKHRGEITLPLGASQETAIAAAHMSTSIQNALHGKPLVKVVYVPNRILNFVVKDA